MFVFTPTSSFYHLFNIRGMIRSAVVAVLAALVSSTSAMLNVVERPMMLYSTVSPKLRIQADKASFAGFPALVAQTLPKSS
jgi:hypothetical protein